MNFLTTLSLLLLVCAVLCHHGQPHDNISAYEEGNNTTSALEGDNTTSALEGDNTTSTLEGNNTTSVLEGNNTTSALEGDNTTSALEGDNTTSALEGDNTTSALERDTRSSALEGDNTTLSQESNNTASAFEENNATLSPLDEAYTTTIPLLEKARKFSTEQELNGKSSSKMVYEGCRTLIWFINQITLLLMNTPSVTNLTSHIETLQFSKYTVDQLNTIVSEELQGNFTVHHLVKQALSEMKRQPEAGELCLEIYADEVEGLQEVETNRQSRTFSDKFFKDIAVALRVTLHVIKKIVKSVLG
ncbi:hypothetical protein Pcinc_034303 [Petrolisthes cinctipes]|uniref:Uncharacterized protein n=1 Tax=Petrolisthes cinctipes TaxID=88211 RepID=A0AAE1JVV5_PETCI|nr:hypothetical protein Pcinc_034303 [Petrolisthes cinctipes]